jgi:hypothetical protein
MISRLKQLDGMAEFPVNVCRSSANYVVSAVLTVVYHWSPSSDRIPLINGLWTIFLDIFSIPCHDNAVREDAQMIGQRGLVHFEFALIP